MIGLLWYKTEDLKKFGYESFEDIVEKNTTTYSTILWPLLIATFYTFLFPLIRWLISNFSAWIKKEEQDVVIKRLGVGSIPTKRFLDMQSSYDEKIKRLSDLIADESVLKQQNNELTTKLAEESTKRIEAESNLLTVKQNTSVILNHSRKGMLTGIWNVKIFIKLLNIDQVWTITDDLIEVHTNDEYGRRDLARVWDYFCDPFSKKAKLEIKPFDNSLFSSDIVVFDTLFWSEDFTTLKNKNELLMVKIHSK